MIDYQLAKLLHILSATLLFGTGLGIAFMNFWGQRQRNIEHRLFAARLTVMMDFLFTFPAVILQPLTGLWLVSVAGYDLREGWLLLSYALYIATGACWLPVVWLQWRMKLMLEQVVATGGTVDDLPQGYYRYFRIWFLLGWPAFVALIAIVYLMIARP